MPLLDDGFAAGVNLAYSFSARSYEFDFMSPLLFFRTLNSDWTRPYDSEAFDWAEPYLGNLDYERVICLLQKLFFVANFQAVKFGLGILVGEID